MNDFSNKMADNSAVVIKQLLVSVTELQVQNEKLHKENTELKTQVNGLRKEVDGGELRRHNVANQQVRNKGIKQQAHD